MEDLIRPEVPARPRWPIILLTIAPGSTIAVLGWLIGYRGDLACCALLILAPILTIVHAVATYRIAVPRSRSDRRFTRAQAALLCVAALILDLVAIAVFFQIFAADFQGV